MGGLKSNGKGVEVWFGETSKYVLGKSDRVVRDVSVIKIKFMKKKTNDIIIDNKPNSDMSPKERRLMELINGAEPKDEAEKQIIKEIKEIEAKGDVVWIPSD